MYRTHIAGRPTSTVTTSTVTAGPAAATAFATPPVGAPTGHPGPRVPALDPEMLNVAAMIDRYGMHVIHVGEGCDCPDCREAPARPAERFGYTIGLTELGHPELLIQGRGARESAAILTRWGDLVVDGQVLDAGHLLCEGDGGITWELVPVHSPSRILRWAERYYRGGGLGGRRTGAGCDEVSALELIPSRRPCPCGSCG